MTSLKSLPGPYKGKTNLPDSEGLQHAPEGHEGGGSLVLHVLPVDAAMQKTDGFWIKGATGMGVATLVALARENK